MHRRSWSWHSRVGSWSRVAPVPGVAPAPVQAAPAGDGCLIQLFREENLAGDTERFSRDVPDLGDRWDEQVASIRVISGTWDVFIDLQYQGEVRRMPPAEYPDLGPQWTRTISSMRCVR
ncbi:MAG: hypothetical protein IT538_03155 [Variibacter sp.]|nr:hypothetical protein [Variibacter sp.]